MKQYQCLQTPKLLCSCQVFHSLSQTESTFFPPFACILKQSLSREFSSRDLRNSLELYCIIMHWSFALSSVHFLSWIRFIRDHGSAEVYQRMPFCKIKLLFNKQWAPLHYLKGGSQDPKDLPLDPPLSCAAKYSQRDWQMHVIYNNLIIKVSEIKVIV